MKKRLVLCFLILAVVLPFFSGCGNRTAEGPSEESFEQKYMQERASLVEANSYQTEVTLSEEEKQLDERLAGWKEEYIASCDGSVPYDMPVLTDENIWNSTLYRFCEALPKGSDLHVHASAVLPFDDLLTFVESRDELYIGTGTTNISFSVMKTLKKSERMSFP